MNYQEQENPKSQLFFYGGYLGVLAPFLLFLVGVVTIALSGSPDERGFWPVLILALGLGLILVRDRTVYSQSVIEGMSQPIVMIMITAWILASIIGVLMTETGFVEALIWLVSLMDLGSQGYVVASFIICCLVSLSTGSSFATILICGPLLYPAGGLAGAPLAVLAGSIIGGATFGDFIAPISDTTIASALSQEARIGAVVRSRVKYIVPVVVLALVAYYVVAAQSPAASLEMTTEQVAGNPAGLVMLLVPVLIIGLFLKGAHLLHGLMFGLLFGIGLGLLFGLMSLSDLFMLDTENFSAKSFIIDGIQRAVGISIFTILLMGLVNTLRRSGLIQDIVQFATKRSRTKDHAENWITAVVGLAVLLTTHSIVAILMVAEFANQTGNKMGLDKVRRSNLLGMTVCVFPFIIPYFIPVILMANMTNTGKDFGIPPVTPWQAGLYNFVSWGLLLMLLFTLSTRIGRSTDKDLKNDEAGG